MVGLQPWTGPWSVGGACDCGWAEWEAWKNKEGLLPGHMVGEDLFPGLALGCCWRGK